MSVGGKVNRMRRDLAKLGAPPKDVSRNVRVITVWGLVSELEDPVGAKTECDRLMAEAQERFPGPEDRQFVFVRNFTGVPKPGPQIRDSWSRSEETSRDSGSRTERFEKPQQEPPLMIFDANVETNPETLN